MEFIDDLGIKELRLQSVENLSSKVNRINFNIDPLSRYTNEINRVKDAKLSIYKTFFEWVYGYRNYAHDKRKTKRRSPSAGALYPIELLIITHIKGTPRLLYYDYRKHDFFLVDNADLHHWLNDYPLNDNESQIVFMSVFWRTVQKYGVRGFRYTYLDVAFILDNFCRLYDASAEPSSALITFPKDDVSSLFQFEEGECILFFLSLKDNLPKLKPAERIEPLYTAPENALSYVPCTSTKFMRVIDFYQKSLPPDPLRYSINMEKTHKHDIAYMYKYLEHRNSANAFFDGAIAEDVYNEIKTAGTNCCQSIDKTLGITFSIISFITNVEGVTAKIENLADGTALEITNSTDFKSSIVNACQNQEIMRNAAFVFILVVDVKRNSKWNYHQYIKSIITGGMICSQLYHTCFQKKLGTTTIGGFSEELLRKIIGTTDLFPIVVQAFGNENSKQIKIDALKTITINK